jgi:hypothetical protein
MGHPAPLTVRQTSMNDHKAPCLNERPLTGLDEAAANVLDGRSAATLITTGTTLSQSLRGTLPLPESGRS